MPASTATDIIMVVIEMNFIVPLEAGSGIWMMFFVIELKVIVLLLYIGWSTQNIIHLLCVLLNNLMCRGNAI